MSTHDYVIANQNGANTRSDLNNALSAIVSNNSSATEPSTTYAYMWWADTANDLLKQRNAADSAWISILTLSTGVPSGGFKNDGTENLTSLGIDDNATSTAVTITNNGVEVKAGGKFTTASGNDLNIDAPATRSTKIKVNGNTGLEVLNDYKGRAPNGLLFGSDTAAANALDDYEEGTWTPTIVGGGTLSIASITSANYTKIGNVVSLQCYIGGFTGGDATNVKMGGLPFTCKSNTFYMGSMNWNGGDPDFYNPHVRVTGGSTEVQFRHTNDTAMAQTDINNGHLIFTLVYKV